MRVSEATRGVAGVVQLTEAVGATGHGVMHSRHGHGDGERLLVLEHLPASLPGEGPSGDDGDLGDQEDGTGHDRLAEIDAHAHRRHILALDEHGVPRGRRGVRRFAIALETELVRDLNGLNQQKILATVGAGGTTATTAPAEGDDRAQLTGRFFLVALYRLAGRHTRGDQGTELHHLRARELEGVEIREQYL